MGQRAASSSVKSAERALEVLLFLASRPNPVPAMAIARHCGLPKSSTYHLLNVMAGHDFVTHYPEERAWGLGGAALEMGSAFPRRQPLVRLAQPVLRRLVSETNETAHLGIMRGDEVLYLCKEQPPNNALPMVRDEGVRLPVQHSALGLAMLMELGDAQVRALDPSAFGAANFSTRGPWSRGELTADLRRARERGYAVELDARQVMSIAAPVIGRTGWPEAAVGLSFLARDHGDRSRMALAERVCAAAASLSRMIGGSPVAAMSHAS